MLFIGACIIGFVLGAVGVCPIDFATHSFQPRDLIIIVGCEWLWSIIYSAVRRD